MTLTGSRGLIRGALCCLAISMLAMGASQASSLLLGEDYQESSNTTSKFPPTPGACNNSIYCYIEFNKVPAGKQLIVTHVGCSLNPSIGDVIVVQLGGHRPNSTAIERFSFLESSKWPSNTPGSTVVVNTQVKQLYQAGDRPDIYIGLTAAADTLGFCNISGQLRNAPV